MEQAQRQYTTKQQRTPANCYEWGAACADCRWGDRCYVQSAMLRRHAPYPVKKRKRKYIKLQD